MLAIESPDFVTVDDVERGLYSTGVKDLIGAVGDIAVTDVAEDYKQASVVVTLGENSYTIPVIEQEDGSVRMKNLYEKTSDHALQYRRISKPPLSEQWH